MTTAAPKLTAPQQRGLDILRAADHPMSPREFALAMWPDSPAWEKRTRKFGGRDPGAIGGTMPMKGASLLWRLYDLGLASTLDGRWTARGGAA